MAIFYQKVPDSSFDIDKDFIVRGSSPATFIVGILLVLVIGVSVFIGMTGFTLGKMIPLLVFPALYFVIPKDSGKVLFRINRSGFFHADQLVTDWDHFIDATVTQKDANPGSISGDLYNLVLHYRKEGHDGYFQRTFLLDNGMDRAEEEIIAAIRFYYRRRDVHPL